jgi:AraC-like DNA-binding protein
MTSSDRPGLVVLPRDQHISEHRIRALVMSGLQDSLRGYRVEFLPVLQEAGLSLEEVGNEFTWIPLEKFAMVLTVAARLTGDPYFGLKHGASWRFTSNPLGYLMANAPDIKTALRSFAHFHTVLSSNHVEFVETNSGGRIEWAYPVTLSNIVQLTDFSLMRFVSRVQSAAGQTWRPVSVGVTHRQPADLAEYERRVGARIAFNQTVNSTTFASPTLSLPMPHADPQLFKLVARFCEEQLERQKATDHPLNRIREAMIRCLQHGSFGPRHVAHELNMTPNSLHRRLRAEGSSFQRLLDDTRRRLTHRYLLESSLRLTDIAARVDYSEISAFSRAARRWFGTSPRSFRRQKSNLDAAA